MRAMGFGPRFISYLEILYRDAQGLVKVGGSLTSPFSFEKGIRQGCPLSGLLYSIAIEPLINILRQKLSTSCFPLPGSNLPCAVSAYADDVSVFVTSDRGFDAIEEAYNLFARSSAACLNTSKSQGLWAGSWTGRNDKPLNFSWNSEGLPFLGVHLGNTHKYVQKKTGTNVKTNSMKLSPPGPVSLTLSHSKAKSSLLTNLPLPNSSIL